MEVYSTRRNLPLGLAFAVFGAGSLCWTYRKRGKAHIAIVGRPRPVTVLPADSGTVTAALEAPLPDGP